MNDAMTLRGIGDADWTSGPQPTGLMRPCPTCGRHMRLAARRVRTDGVTAVAYYPVCPNRCAIRRPGDYPGIAAQDGPVGYVAILTVRPDGTKRVTAGRKKDAAHAMDLWNEWVDAHGSNITPAARRKVWDEAAECPVCHREIIEAEPFANHGMPRIGCPDHPAVASITLKPADWSGHDPMRTLRDRLDQWAWLIGTRTCPICDGTIRFGVNEDGNWQCACGCDVTDPDREVTLTPVAAIRAYRGRLRRRLDAKRERDRRRHMNLELWETISKELEDTVKEDK